MISYLVVSYTTDVQLLLVITQIAYQLLLCDCMLLCVRIGIISIHIADSYVLSFDRHGVCSEQCYYTPYHNDLGISQQYNEPYHIAHRLTVDIIPQSPPSSGEYHDTKLELFMRDF